MDGPPEGMTRAEGPPGDVQGCRRPLDLAVLLLAIGTEPPRARARDQQADRAGGALHREVLDRLAALDPDPDQIDQALATIVADLGEPTGPTRAVASTVRQEWDDALLVPGYWSWLVSEALERSRRDADGDGDRGRRSEHRRGTPRGTP